MRDWAERYKMYLRGSPAELACVAVGLVWVGYFWACAVARVDFPLELEWLEGVSLHHAQRIAQGEAVYPVPSERFVPLLYTPLHPWLMGMAGKIVGVGYLQGRILSLVAVGVMCAGAWRIVVREGKGHMAGLTVVGLILSGYAFTHRWLDIARPDSLYLAFTVWGAACVRDGWGSRRQVLWAGLLMSAAFWTKQTAFVAIVASGLGVLVTAPRQAWIYVVTIGSLCGGGVLIGQWLTEGWLWTYIHELHQSHAFNWVRFYRKSWGMLLHAFPGMACVGLVLLLRALRPLWGHTRRLGEDARTRWERMLTGQRGFWFWGIMALGGLVAGALGYSTQWAESNAFLPSLVFGAIFVVVAVPDGTRWPWWVLGAQMLGALIFEPRYQIVFDEGLHRLPQSYRIQRVGLTIPDASQWARAKAQRGRLEALGGDVGYVDAFGTAHRGSIFAPARPWWSVLAGGEGHVSSMGLRDLGASASRGIRDDLRKRLRAAEDAAVWLEGPVPAWMRTALAEKYRLDLRLRGDARALPMTGYMSKAGMLVPYTRAQTLFVRTSARTPKSAATLVLADFEDGTLQGFSMVGRAFGRDPARSVGRDRPAVGPMGGEFLLSSLDSTSGRRAKGRARSPVFRVGHAGGRLSCLLGSSGRRRGLSVAVIDTLNARRLELPIPELEFDMQSVELEIPVELAEQPLQLELVDDSVREGLVIDDIWVQSH